MSSFVLFGTGVIVAMYREDIMNFFGNLLFSPTIPDNVPVNYDDNEDDEDEYEYVDTMWLKLAKNRYKLNEELLSSYSTSEKCKKYLEGEKSTGWFY